MLLFTGYAVLMIFVSILAMSIVQVSKGKLKKNVHRGDALYDTMLADQDLFCFMKCEKLVM